MDSGATTLKASKPAEPSCSPAPAAKVAPATTVGEVPCPPCRLTGDGLSQAEDNRKG